MCKIIQMFKNLIVNNAPEFKIDGEYTTNQCAYIDSLDANVLTVALKSPCGWMKFKVAIKGLHITKSNLVPTFNYAWQIEQAIKDKDFMVLIHKIANKYGVLEGTIFIKDVNEKYRTLRDILYYLYTPHLIMGIPVRRVTFNPTVEVKILEGEVSDDSDWNVV
jgi:hypothetical protein